MPGGHVILKFADAAGIESAIRALGGGAPASEALTLQVPSDGNVASLRALLARLDDPQTEIEQLSVHIPDLDDVFLALTSLPTAAEEISR